MKAWHPEVCFTRIPLGRFFRHPKEKKVWIFGPGKEDKEKSFYPEKEHDKHQPETVVK